MRIRGNAPAARTIGAPSWMRRRGDAEVAVHALRLRRWALAAFAGTVSSDVARGAREAPAAAWRVFLGTERCAIALGQHAAAQPVLGSLPEAVRGVFGQVRLRETQRAMSARMQLAILARLAAGSGTPVVVLKGGVAIAEGYPVHVADVDVLVPRSEALGIAEALRDEGGFQARRADHLDGRGGHHLAPRFVPDAVGVEVHFAIPGMAAERVSDGSIPLQGIPGLRRPAVEDHLFHTVYHAVVHHPERLGRLRDVLLLAREDAEERTWAAVVHDLRGGVAGERAAALADFARRLRRAPAGDDPFARMAVANYLVAAERLRTGRGERPLLTASVSALVNGRGEYRRFCEQQLRTLYDHPAGRAEEVLASTVPALFLPVRLFWRAAKVVSAVPRALRVAHQARRLARSA